MDFYILNMPVKILLVKNKNKKYYFYFYLNFIIFERIYNIFIFIYF